MDGSDDDLAEVYTDRAQRAAVSAQRAAYLAVVVALVAVFLAGAAFAAAVGAGG